MKEFRVAAIQTEPKLGDVSRNLKRASKLIKKASQKGARVVCLPELFDTGYDLEWIRSNAGINAKTTKEVLKGLCKDLGVFIVAGIANLREGHIYNSSYIFSPPGQIIGRYDKNFLFRAKPQEEHKYFAEGGEIEVVETPFGNLGFAICNDIRYPALFALQALEGAKVIFVSAAWGKARLDHWLTLLKARAIENQIYIVAADQAGKCDHLEFAGYSVIIDFDGNVIAERKGGEGIIFAEIDYLALKEKRRELPTFTVLKEKSSDSTS